jgi:hypothetical protein
LLFGVGVGLLAMSFVAGHAKPAGAQSADAEARCTGDVMRLCSEFVPDADSIVVCLKAKRLQLEPSCLNALSPVPPEPVALAAPARKKIAVPAPAGKSAKKLAKKPARKSAEKLAKKPTKKPAGEDVRKNRGAPLDILPTRSANVPPRPTAAR